MSRQDEAGATDRLRRALLAVHTAQNSLLSAHRRVGELPQAGGGGGWGGAGPPPAARQRAHPAGGGGAPHAVSAAGLVAGAADRHLVTQAQRQLAEDA